MLTLAPVTVTGSPQRVSLPTASLPGHWPAVLLANQSPYALQPQLGSYSGRWLLPYTADLYQLPSDATDIHLNPSSVGVTQIGSPTLLVSLYEQDDRPPSNYPQSIVTQAPGNVQGPSNLTAGQSLTFTIPPGSVYATLLITFSQVAAIPYTLVGNNSGQYLSETIPQVGIGTHVQAPRLIRLDLADTSLVLTNTGTTFTTASMEFHTDSNGPRNGPAANDLFWQANAALSGAGTLTLASSAQTPGNLKTVLDYAIFTVAAATGRVYVPAVWDGAVGGTRIAAGQLGNQSGGGALTPPPVIFKGHKSSIGNVLSFDLGFANIAGEASAITAVGHYE